jgi:hypothetical protein
LLGTQIDGYSIFNSRNSCAKVDVLLPSIFVAVLSNYGFYLQVEQSDVEEFAKLQTLIGQLQKVNELLTVYRLSLSLPEFQCVSPSMFKFMPQCLFLPLGSIMAQQFQLQ